MLCFEIFYKTVGYAVVFPFVEYLLSLLPGLIGTSYLSQENAAMVLGSYKAILLLIGIFILTALYIYYEIAALFVYVEKGWQKERVSTFGLWKAAFRKILGLFSPKRLGVFLLFPVLILSGFSYLSGYLRAVRVPEFVMDFIQGNALFYMGYVVFLILLNILLFFYLFGFPALLFGGQSFFGSWRESWRLLRGKKLRTIGKMLLAGFLLAVLCFLVAVVFVLLFACAIRIFYPIDAGRYHFQLYFPVWMRVGKIVGGAVFSTFLCAVMLVLYHRYRNDERPEQAAERKRSTLRSSIRPVTAVCTVLLLIIFCETEVGGKVFSVSEYNTKIIAHRAGAAFAPENTLSALSGAIADGAEMAEIDVQQLRDGTLIVMHDVNFGRTTGVDLNVWDADYTQVKSFDAAIFHMGNRREPIPALEDMLAAAKGKINLMIELKANGHERNLVEETLRLIRKYQMEKQCIVASMNLGLLKKSKELAPEIETTYITALLITDDYRLDYVDGYSVETSSLSAGMAAQVHFQGKKMYAWTANSEDTIEKILRCGADGLVTDDVILADYCMKKHGKNLLSDALSELFFP